MSFPPSQTMSKLIRLLVLVALCGSARSARAQDTTRSPASRPFLVSSADSSTLLFPGDVIRLRIWREPDLSGDFPVDETSRAVFPKIGEYRVSGVAPEDLKARLISAFAVYLRNPSIEVMFLHRVNVLGAVQRPGLYPVDVTMTLSDVLSLAGGASALGEPDRVELIRDGKLIATRVARATRIADLPLRSGDQLFVPERSWVVRNSTLVAASLTTAATLVIAFLRR